MRTHDVPRWFTEVRVEVETLISNSECRKRFQEMIRAWSKASQTFMKWPEISWINDTDHPLRCYVPPKLAIEAPPQRFPLPVEDKALSLQEKYVALAMIHDALIEPAARSVPWDNEFDPYQFFVDLYLLDRNGETLRETLPDSDEPLLRKVLEDVKHDLQRVLSVRLGDPQDAEMDELDRYVEPLTSDQERIVRFLWTRKHATKFTTLKEQCWDKDVQTTTVSRTLERIGKRWTEEGIYDVSLNISKSKESVKLVKPDKSTDKKTDSTVG